MARRRKCLQKAHGSISKFSGIARFDGFDEDSIGVVIVANKNVLVATARGNLIVASQIRIGGTRMFRMQGKETFLSLGFGGEISMPDGAEKSGFGGAAATSMEIRDQF